MRLAALSDTTNPSQGSSFKTPIREPTFIYKPLPEFHHFADFPAELRLMIWRSAIPVDFSDNPISVKPYSYTSRNRRMPPKTSGINQESRKETLKYLRRLELQTPEVSEHEGHKWHRKYPIHFILWDISIDVLTLDWWSLVSNVTDVLKYLNLETFVNEKKGTISCVQILDIDTQAWSSGYGTLSLGPHVMEPIEKKLKYFRRIADIVFPGYIWRRRNGMILED
ncbi:hypothetical protein NA56DRAFT_742251 [Hyaloscypha hepaticicola]|uniref:2EXR domain-containing protein n=1 Tax=Hyaloscypha hepaticicola TaxID=2082293 RepID=A0A2J6QPB5_9HELO|nr:hypothetical protein NA56DRAFT_742251 [Hyaloscypha hepaticicola]